VYTVDTFFTHRFRQRLAKAGMRPTPVVNRGSPPTKGRLGIFSTGEGEGLTDLGGTHATGSGIAPFDSRGVGFAVAQNGQGLGHSSFAAEDITNLDVCQPLTGPMFDDLNHRQGARHAIAKLGPATSRAVTSRLVGLAENLWKQGAIGRFTITEEDQVMPVTQPSRPIGQQAANQAFVTPALDMTDDELALRVYQLGFPGGLLFVAGKAMSFIGLQRFYLKVLYALVVIVLSMLAQATIQPPHRRRLYPYQARRTFEGTPFGQMLGYRDRLRFPYLTVPQGRVLPFTELCATAPTAQVAYPLLAVHFADYQIFLALLTIHFTFHVDTC
jgi:hypothetical protein